MFDATASRKAERSLNDNIETGPNLSPDIDELQAIRNTDGRRCGKSFPSNNHARGRSGRTALVVEAATKKDSELPIVDTWRMKRVTFGTKPSSFLLAATIHHHQDAVKEKFPNTVGELKKGIYVDDALLEAADMSTAETMCNEARRYLLQPE